MKIVLINAVYGIMSTGRTYMELQDFLQKKGHECVVVYGNQRGNYPETLYMGNTLDHKCHALLGRITGKGGCYSSLPTRRLIRFLKDYQPDVVHLGNLHGNFINIPMLLKFLGENDIVTTVTLHDCYFFTGGCMHYTSNGCYKWKSECGKCPHYKSQNSWVFDRTKELQGYKIKYFNSIRRLGVIGVSEWILNEATQSPVFSNAAVSVKIHDWIDLKIFHPCGDTAKEQLKITGKKMILGVASGWGPKKGLYDFIELSQMLNSDYKIVLVGKMPEDTSLPDNILSVPATENVQELVGYYSAADVFVQLSKEETFGKVVAEALACGTPAVVYDTTASPELVEDGCGIAVNVSAGIDGIYNAIMEVMSDPKEKYSTFSRGKAMDSFEQERCCNEFLNLWCKLLAE